MRRGAHALEQLKGLAGVLAAEGYIEYDVEENVGKRQDPAHPHEVQPRPRTISGIKRVSKPTCAPTEGYQDSPALGAGVAVISTSQDC